MRSCDSYRARITAIFATAINHPIRSPASSANPHNHAPHGVSRHHGDSGPVILCTRESPNAFPHAHSHTHSHTTCTVRHAPSTTARAKLHTVPHGSVTAQPTNKHTHAQVVNDSPCGVTRATVGGCRKQGQAHAVCGIRRRAAAQKPWQALVQCPPARKC